MATRIRERSRVTLNCTRFNFSHADAFIDKVTVVVDIGEIPASNYLDVNASLDLIALSGNYKKTGWGSTTRLVSQDDGRLFTYCISVRQVSGGVAILQVTVYYNPTRCFVYWGDALPNSNNIASKVWASPRLKATQMQLSRDGNDNFIPTSKLSLARSIKWDEYTKNVLSLFISKIQQDIGENSHRISVRLYQENQWKWVIQSLEVYWEFQHNEAPTLLRRMFANAQSRFASVRERYFIQRDLSVVGSSYAYELLRKNTMCCAYAKLTDRIRLECRFNTNPRQIFGDEINLDQNPNFNLSFLKGFLHILITKAIKLMQPFTELDVKMFTEPYLNINDMVAVSQALGKLDPHLTGQALLALIDCGRLPVPAPKTPMVSIIRRLKAQGWLVRGQKRRGEKPYYYAAGALGRHTTSLRVLTAKTPERAA